MPAPNCVRAEVRAHGHRTSFTLAGGGNPERVFTANVFAMPYGFVIRRVPGGPAQTEHWEAPPAALPGKGPRTFDNGSEGALAEAERPERQLVKETTHVFEVTLTSACFVDDEVGVYLVPHDHLRVAKGGDGIRRLRLRTMGDAEPTEGEIRAGLTKLRDSLQRQVDELDRQLGAYYGGKPSAARSSLPEVQRREGLL